MPAAPAMRRCGRRRTGDAAAGAWRDPVNGGGGPPHAAPRPRLADARSKPPRPRRCPRGRLAPLASPTLRLMRRLVTAAALLALAPAASAAQDWRRPEFSAPRSADARADGATLVDVQARAGTLRVEGRAGLREVRAHGTARASSRQILEDVQLVVERRGATVYVEVRTPDDLRDGYAGLDLVVEVPEGVDADVRDGSGDLEVRDVGRLALTD